MSPGGVDGGRLEQVDRFLAGYVDDGRLPGWSYVVTRHGQVVHRAVHGSRDVEAGLPVERDTLFRIFSMSKPITSVAAMMLYEEGAFDLNDPIARWLPAFAEPRVYVGGPASAPGTVAAVEPIRVRHLLTHTAGLTYGFHHVHPVDEMYRAAGFEFAGPEAKDLAAVCDAWAALPLLYQPGAEWVYSVATDVLGRFVEVVSGQSLDDFFRTRIFEPLGMTDTGFEVAEPDLGRLAALYVRDPGTGRAARHDRMGDLARRPPDFLSGGGGLIGTIDDYQRFAQMLLQGGELEGRRVLGSRTVRYMTRNHLPGQADLQAFGRPLFAETRYDGVGFGLGFSVVVDPAANGVLSSPGEFAWGGLASTAFWVDPLEDMSVVFMTQLMPSSTYPIRTRLRQMIYAALTD